MSRLRRNIANVLTGIGINTSKELIQHNRHRASSPVGFYVKADYSVSDGSAERYTLYDCLYTLTEFMNAYRKFGYPVVEGTRLTFPQNTTGEGLKSNGH